MLPCGLCYVISCFLSSFYSPYVILLRIVLLIPLKYHTGNRSCRLLQYNIITTKTYRSIFFHCLGEGRKRPGGCVIVWNLEPLASGGQSGSKLIPIGLAVRVFANGPGDLGSVPGRVIPKTQKMVVDASLLNTQHYKVRIKGKVEPSREGVAPSPTSWCSSYRKGSLRVTLDYGRQLYFTYMPERKTLNEDLFYRGSSANLPRLHTCENKVPFWDFSHFCVTIYIYIYIYI